MRWDGMLIIIIIIIFNITMMVVIMFFVADDDDDDDDDEFFQDLNWRIIWTSNDFWWPHVTYVSLVLGGTALLCDQVQDHL